MKTLTSVLLLALGAAVAASSPHLAAAEVRSEAAPLRYDADWYRSFAPRTALDMVRQTPGFTLDQGEARRGLSGAVGNVLVDGRRPSAKEQTLEEILQRIPAAQVLRIELLRGTQTAGDASGRAVLINVVRTPFTGQGVGAIGFEYAQQHRAMPNGFMAWTGRAGAIDYALGANSYSLRRELPGSRILENAAGQVTGTRRDVSPRDFAEYTVTGEASMELGGGRARFTGQAHYERYHEDSGIDTLDPNGARQASSSIPFTQSSRGAEFGGHFDRDLGAWNLASVLLLTRGTFASDVRSTNRDAAGNQVYLYAQQLERDSGETILRGALARNVTDTHRIEIGLEGAFNTLDAALAATQDFGMGVMPIDVPNSNVLIEETRAEAFVSHDWHPAGRWSFDWRLAGEVSRLEFTGDSNQVVELAYAKPSLQVTRAVGATNQFRARIHRDVGQLDFTDFVSSLSLSDDRLDGGNPDLKPQTSWDAELAADLRPGADIALSLTAFHRWVSDTADFRPVVRPDRLIIAPGNIGDSRIYGVRLTARAPLFFVRGGSVTFDGMRQESRATDPLTREIRGISGLERWKVATGFRQDLPRLAWGVNYTQNAMTSSYLVDEIDRKRPSPSLDVFFEAALGRGMRLRVAAVSVLGQPQLRERLFYAGDRRSAFAHAELGERDPGTWYQMSISGSF